jgi:hypothetical protein
MHGFLPLLNLLQTIHFLISQKALNILKMFKHAFITKLKYFENQRSVKVLVRHPSTGAA